MPAIELTAECALTEGEPMPVGRIERLRGASDRRAASAAGSA